MSYIPAGNRHTRLAIARGVAQVVEEDDGIWSKLDVGAHHVRAEVLGLRLGAPGKRCDADSVLGVLLERRIWAWPAVAVAHVDEQVRALDVRDDVVPRRVRIEDAANVHAVGLG